MPAWLSHFRPGDPFPRKEFFQSRVLFYPGARIDGHPIRYFGKAHAVHCFVYADFGISATDVREALSDSNPKHPSGYRVVHLTELAEKDVFPGKWKRHPLDPPGEPKGVGGDLKSHWYYLWAVLERVEGLDEQHGPKRWALLHVGREAVETFDALFCQPRQNLPYAVLLQEHVTGGNCWEGFGGAEGPLWNLINQTGKNKLPKWLLVGENNTEPWPGYRPVDYGVHPMRRGLYLRYDQSGRSKNSLRREKIRNSPETETFRRKVLEFCAFCEKANRHEVAHSIKLDLSVMTHMPFYGEQHGERRRRIGFELAVQYAQLLDAYGDMHFAKELLQRVTVQQSQLLRKIARRNSEDKRLFLEATSDAGIWDHAIPTKVVRDEIVAMLKRKKIEEVEPLLKVYVRAGQRKLSQKEDRIVAKEYRDKMPKEWNWSSPACDVFARYKAAGIDRFTQATVPGGVPLS
jgi:hypothetical protein